MTAPLVRFVIGGMQKSGTTALAGYLREHPGIRLPRDKEAHVFDAPGFDDAATVADIDRAYDAHFGDGRDDRLVHGDATPIYAFHPRIVARIARYNPAMRWILLLRHPVDRALSHFHMERNRGNESWPLWPAMLLERWRLRGHHDDFSARSPLRRWSYRARGDYARQLDALYAAFPREQVLLLTDVALRTDPAGTLGRVLDFLSLPPPGHAPEPRREFVGNYVPHDRGDPAWRMLHWLLRGELRALRDHHGIDLDHPAAAPSPDRRRLD